MSKPQYSKNKFDKKKKQVPEENEKSWCDIVIEQINTIRDDGVSNMLNFDAVMHLASKKGFDELADFMSMTMYYYSNFISTEDIEHVLGVFESLEVNKDKYPELHD